MVYPYTGRMPRWALLPLFIFGCTCVVPLFVLGLTGGNLRRAFEAWCQFVAILLAMAPPFCPILPKHVFGDGADMKTHPKNNLPVGSGPYKVVSFNPREAIVLERHAGYFFKDRPQFERVIFRMVSDNAAQALALEKGEVDLLPGSVTLSQFGQLSKSRDVVLSRKGGEAIGPQVDV